MPGSKGVGNVRPEVDDEYKGLHDEEGQAQKSVVCKKRDAFAERIVEKSRSLIGGKVVDERGLVYIFQLDGVLAFPSALFCGYGGSAVGR